VPFSTGLLAECIRNEFSLVIIAYGVAHLITGLWLAAIWGHATRNRRLVSADLEPWVVRALMRTVLQGAALYAVGIPVAFFSWSAGLVIYMSVPICYLLPSRVDHHWMFLGKSLAAGEPAAAQRAPTRGNAQPDFQSPQELRLFG